MEKIVKYHFKSIAESLHIVQVDFDRELVVNAIKNFSQHPSILKIKENTNSSACFTFGTVSKEDLTYQLRPHKSDAKV